MPATETATAVPQDLTLWLSPALPAALRAPLEALQTVDDRPVAVVTDPELAQVRVEPEPELPLARWIYAVVVPFPTVRDELTLDELEGAWEGRGDSGLLLSPASETALAGRFPAGRLRAQVMPAQDLLQNAWSAGEALAIVPFEALEPRWKVLALEGQSPIRKDFDPASYPLAVDFGLSGDPAAMAMLRDVLAWPGTNRDPERLTVLMMTGVTALTRATAWRMESYGIEYPAALIGDWLREADLTHVSNEVSFAVDCPLPDPAQATLRFCSSDKYIALLESVGVDLVELTGNHVMDWGPQAFLHSLDLYRARGWAYFGGGADLQDAGQPALVEHNGNRLAFLGCNAAGPPSAWARVDSPGSLPCDMDQLQQQVARLQAQGYLVAFTFQWAESYGPAPLPAQREAFRSMAEAGAVIVSGSQAHRPQGFEFYAGGFIHYGPGNLFFDQMWSPETRQEFLDRYVIYEGRLISTELLTAMLEDWAQPRPMTLEERTALLEEIFRASGW